MCRTPINQLLGYLDAITSIAATGFSQLQQSRILKRNILNLRFKNLSQLKWSVILKVYRSESVLERSKQFIWLGSSKQKSLLFKVKWILSITPTKVASMTSFSIKDSEKCVGNILGQLMCLIKQHRNLIIHDERNKNLVEEILQIFNCGAVKLKKWSIATIHVLQVAAKLSGKFCFTQSFSTNQ